MTPAMIDPAAVRAKAFWNVTYWPGKIGGMFRGREGGKEKGVKATATPCKNENTLLWS